MNSRKLINEEILHCTVMYNVKNMKKPKNLPKTVKQGFQSPYM